MASDGVEYDLKNTTIEKREDEVLIVRVRSTDAHSQPLPDAVFSFRPRDPQYDIWNRRWLYAVAQQAQQARD